VNAQRVPGCDWRPGRGGQRAAWARAGGEEKRPWRRGRGADLHPDVAVPDGVVGAPGQLRGDARPLGAHLTHRLQYERVLLPRPPLLVRLLAATALSEHVGGLRVAGHHHAVRAGRGPPRCHSVGRDPVRRGHRHRHLGPCRRIEYRRGRQRGGWVSGRLARGQLGGWGGIEQTERRRRRRGLVGRRLHLHLATIGRIL